MWQGRQSTRAMFGDVFCTREDYRQGTFYSGRREFLHSSEKNVLEPPQDFKTKKQMRNFLKIKKGGEINFQKLTFDFKEKEGFFQASGANKLNSMSGNKETKKDKQKQKKMIIVERFSSTAKEDWLEEFQAGCQLWVNRSTGEVSDFCPWEEDSPSVQGGGENSVATGEDDEWGALETSSASLDYDSRELADLFHILDNAPKSPLPASPSPSKK